MSDKPKRFQTQTERDVQGMSARRARDAAASTFGDDEVTGQYEGEELHRMRARRPTVERIQRLEDKHDATLATVNKMSGKLDTLLELAGAEADARTERAKAEAVERESRRKYIVPIITAVGIAAAAVAAAALHGGCS